ncbi:MAG: GntP family permease [Bacteroides sp.]|nr:GntP family permease [Treponema brennaborense]MCM1470332.1 GntP family permease [Bacteroides sp.]
MQGLPLIIAFFFAIALMIFSISKLKIHPFLALMGISLLLAFIARIPLRDIPGIIGAGFSGTFSNIGIVIILGALIGTFLEKTGAALKLSDMVIKIVGKKKPELSILIMGWIVSIPVFCDSGFVILNPIRKALVKRTRTSSVAMSVALSAGLYISHVFIPPTPGPIAAANTLGIGENLLIVIGMGILASILPLIAGYFYSIYIGKKIKANDEQDSGLITQTYEELLAGYGKLPNGFLTLAPIVVPILLMSLSSLSAMLGWKGTSASLCSFFGAPIIALGVGTVFGIILLASQKKLHEFYEITNDTLKVVGPILFITASGGILGKVVASSGLVAFITQHSATFRTIGIFFPFFLAAVIKSAQGSSTVAITTTAGILAPLMNAIGFDTPILAALCVMAIGAGSMTVSHANDSYFWIVANFGEMNVEDGYRAHTMMTFVIGIAAMAGVYILSMFFR